ncbi:hypothetical protein NQ318_000594 [Aromia moschata]|uniref:TIR domain-containing protein n=1 Tax=Aromia moschata TaxID=1265417 RepID=A0AAV8XRP9_9CUCU|nr:hypothetical protein NQ318_000594 [Aromia moschata]
MPPAAACAASTPDVYVVCFGRNFCRRTPVDINITAPLLKLTSTHISQLTPEDFDGMPHLEALQIEGNLNLTRILPGTFNGNLTKLTNVSISYNPNLRYLDPLSFEGLVNLRILLLKKNGFEKVHDVTISLSANVLPNLQTLALNENKFIRVAKSDFTPMENSTLEELNMVLCRLDYLHPDSLSPLKNLQVLRLGENSFSSATLTDLIARTIDLGIPLKLLNLYSVGFRKSPPRKLMEALARSNVSNLNLSNNQFEVITSDFFPYMPNLRILDLREVLALEIRNDAFRKLPNLKTLLLSGNKLPTIPQGLITLLVSKRIYLRDSVNCKFFFWEVVEYPMCPKMGNPFRYLKSLEHLGLEKNRLKTISSIDFSDLVNLRSIDLSENFLTAWESRVFEANNQLQVMVLRVNKITMFTRAMLEDFSNLTELEIRYNPFSCDCHSYSVFHDWFSHEILEYFGNVYNGTITCDIGLLSINLAVVLPLVLLILFFIILALFVYYYRWHLRYWVFLTRLYLSRKGRIKPRTEKMAFANYAYDAFVSYSNEDRNFVVRLIGTIISESVLESVAQSRRTLLIISDNYAKSQWCRWESQIAEHHRLFFENEAGEYVDDSLVLIKLGPVSDSHLTPTLKYLLKTRIYLQWEAEEKKQKAFWDKLRNALAPPKHEQTVLECTHI